MKRAQTTPPPINELPMPGPTLGPLPAKLKGLDSLGRPKQLYLDRVRRMAEPGLTAECDRTISASAETTDPRADAHWQCLACFREARRRWTVPLMSRPWHEASSHAGLDADMHRA
jgi:hypothetical protein